MICICCIKKFFDDNWKYRIWCFYCWAISFMKILTLKIIFFMILIMLSIRLFTIECFSADLLSLIKFRKSLIFSIFFISFVISNVSWLKILIFLKILKILINFQTVFFNTSKKSFRRCRCHNSFFWRNLKQNFQTISAKIIYFACAAVIYSFSKNVRNQRCIYEYIYLFFQNQFVFRFLIFSNSWKW